MTTLEKSKLIGKWDLRTSYGRDDAFVVNPINGKSAWRALSTIKVLASQNQ